MNFRSIAQLSDQLLHWSRQIPKDIELVAGVPRSGLLAANILALYLNLPLTDVTGLIAGRILDTGRRGRLSSEEANQFLSIPRKVLVLDEP